MAKPIDLKGLTLQPALQQLLEDLGKVRGTRTQRVRDYLNVSPSFDGALALRVTASSVNISLDPLRARALAAKVTGASLRHGSATSYLTITAAQVGQQPQETLALALAALDWREREGPRRQFAKPHAATESAAKRSSGPVCGFGHVLALNGTCNCA